MNKWNRHFKRSKLDFWSIVTFSIILSIVLVFGYVIDWLCCYGASAFLGWCGVPGFPKPIDWWVPIALAAFIFLIKSIFPKNDKK